MIKIKVSSTDDVELQAVLKLLRPFIDGKRVKKVANKAGFSCVYITPKKL
ncbi:MAG: hypothetical protein ACOH15_07295 [Acetobacterium sp.]